MDDRMIVDLFYERSESAIEQTQLKYGALCNRLAVSVLDSAEDSVECVNDVLLKLWNSIPPERPVSLKAYVLRITRNVSLDRLRHRRSSKRNNIGDVPLSELEGVLADFASPDENLEAEELGRLINKFLRTLGEEKRFVFISRYWHYKSVKAIASEFDMSASKVKSLLFRIRAELREYLEKEGYII